MTNETFQGWREQRLAELPPQIEETIHPLVMEVELVIRCTSNICKGRHGAFVDYMGRPQTVRPTQEMPGL